MGNPHRRRRLLAWGTAVLASTVLVAQPASAAPPPNDRLRHAIEIPSTPYTNEQGTLEAGSDGPRFCSNNGSVFYTFTATETRRLQADTLGSDYDTVLGVFTGGFSDAVEVACNDDRFGLDSAVRFRAVAGETYNFIIGYCCGDGGDDVDENGNLVFTLARAYETAPLSANVSVDPEATVNHDGTAELTGTADCSTTRVGMSIFGALRQTQGDVTIRGRGDVSFVCDASEPTEWIITVTPRGDGSFAPGESEFQYSLSASSWDESYFARGRRADVTLAEA